MISGVNSHAGLFCMIRRDLKAWQDMKHISKSMHSSPLLENVTTYTHRNSIFFLTEYYYWFMQVFFVYADFEDTSNINIKAS